MDELKRKATEKAAKLMLEPLVEKRRGEFGYKTDLTVKEYFDFWLYQVKYNTVKQTTFDKNEQMYKKFILPEIGHLKMSEVTNVHLQRLLNTVAEKRVQSTVKKVNEVIGQGFRYAYCVGDIPINPTVMLRIPKAEHCSRPSKKTKYYTEEQMIAMTKAIVDCYEEHGYYRIAPLFFFIYSMIETAKANELDPKKYLSYLLDLGQEPKCQMLNLNFLLRGAPQFRKPANENWRKILASLALWQRASDFLPGNPPKTKRLRSSSLLYQYS